MLDALVGGWQVSTIWTVRTGLPVNVTLVAQRHRSRTRARTTASSTATADTSGPTWSAIPNGASDASEDRFTFLERRLRGAAAQHAGQRAAQLRLGPGQLDDGPEPGEAVHAVPRLTPDMRVEAFNLFNHTNYADPNTNFGTAQFGSITSAGLPRIVQLAVRVGF